MNHDEKENIKTLQTITSWLKYVIKYRNKNIALVEEEEAITYFELGRKINQYSEIFTRLGIAKGKKVILQMDNIKEYIYALFGLINIGAVPVVVNLRLGTYEIERIINQTDPVAYLYYSNNSNTIPRILKKIKEDYTNIMIFSAKEINNLCKERCYEEKYYEADVEDIAFLMLSGGTTGAPKLVPITHRMIYYHISSYCRKFQLSFNDSYLAILPLSHKMGLYSPGLLNSLFVGGKTVLCKSGSCDEWFSLIEHEKITITSLVPTLANVWIDFLRYDNSYNLSTLKGIYIGGSVIRPHIIYDLLKFVDCNIQIIYAATEGIAMYSIYNSASKKIVASYKHLINGQESVKIVDENGNKVKENEKGELIIKSPYTIKNYFNLKKDISKKFTKDGYFKTGDMCIWSKEYGYKILGRIVDQINRAGEKIDPIEIENMIMGYPDIDAAVSVGVENDFLGQKHYLFIKSNNKSIKIRDIRMFLESQGLASYKFPDELVILDKIPLTYVNKIDRKRLRKIVKA